MIVVFHDNSLCVRGTTVALYDYAYYCKHMYNVQCYFMYNKNHFATSNDVINKFKNEFGQDSVYSYYHPNEIDGILTSLKADAFFMIKTGKWDGIISNVCENWVNAIGICDKSDVHGQKFFMGSKWLSDIINNDVDYVPYMINLPNVEGNLRSELNIPENAVVFGRNGGNDSFDIQYVKQCIADNIDKRSDIYFLFQGTDPFYRHPRIIYLPASSDLEFKVKFMNTSDALLHARDVGESFGLTCGEFSTRNKPVITYFGSKERNHIDILGDDGIYYNNYEEIKNILLNFTIDNTKDWNKYKEYTPEKVMERFKKLYMD